MALGPQEEQYHFRDSLFVKAVPAFKGAEICLTSRQVHGEVTLQESV